MDVRSLHLVVCGPGELGDIERIERACFPDALAYDRSMLRAMLSRRKAVTYLLRDDLEPVAYASGYWRQTAGEGHVESVAVVPAARGQGLSRLLMDLLHDRMRDEGMARCILEVSVNRHEAISLYEGLGYRTLRRLRGYYENPVNGSRDAWLMEFPLGGPG